MLFFAVQDDNFRMIGTIADSVKNGCCECICSCCLFCGFEIKKEFGVFDPSSLFEHVDFSHEFLSHRKRHDFQIGFPREFCQFLDDLSQLQPVCDEELCRFLSWVVYCWFVFCCVHEFVCLEETGRTYSQRPPRQSNKQENRFIVHLRSWALCPPLRRVFVGRNRV